MQRLCCKKTLSVVQGGVAVAVMKMMKEGVNAVSISVLPSNVLLLYTISCLCGLCGDGD